MNSKIRRAFGTTSSESIGPTDATPPYKGPMGPNKGPWAQGPWAHDPWALGPWALGPLFMGPWAPGPLFGPWAHGPLFGGVWPYYFRGGPCGLLLPSGQNRNCHMKCWQSTFLVIIVAVSRCSGMLQSAWCSSAGSADGRITATNTMATMGIIGPREAHRAGPPNTWPRAQARTPIPQIIVPGPRGTISDHFGKSPKNPARPARVPPIFTHPGPPLAPPPPPHAPPRDSLPEDALGSPFGGVRSPIRPGTLFSAVQLGDFAVSPTNS